MPMHVCLVLIKRSNVIDCRRAGIAPRVAGNAFTDLLDLLSAGDDETLRTSF